MSSRADSALKFAAAISDKPDLQEAARDACQQARSQLAADVNLAVVFFSGYRPEDAGPLAKTLQKELGAACVLGCPAESLGLQRSGGRRFARDRRLARPSAGRGTDADAFGIRDDG